MRAVEQPLPVDLQIAEIATRQHGVITHAQLTALGLGRGAIRHRLATGRLHRLHRGVYLVGHAATAPWTPFIAAVLACGPGALVSHISAAYLWGLVRGAGSTINVTVPGRSRHAKKGIVLHLPRGLHPEDRAVHEGIPVTSAARTLLDLAEVVSSWQLVRAVEQAERLGLFDLRAVQRLSARTQCRRGTTLLAAAIAEAGYAVPWTRSTLEQEFLGFCRKARIPQPAVNLWVEGQEVDAAWVADKLIVELDSYEFHRTRASFERDRKRDTALQLAEYRVVRVTQRRLQSEAAELATEIRMLLGI